MGQGLRCRYSFSFVQLLYWSLTESFWFPWLSIHCNNLLQAIWKWAGNSFMVKDSISDWNGIFWIESLLATPVYYHPIRSRLEWSGMVRKSVQEYRLRMTMPLFWKFMIEPWNDLLQNEMGEEKTSYLSMVRVSPSSRKNVPRDAPLSSRATIRP